MSYSLDGGPDIPILGDTVIPMPDFGQHTIFKLIILVKNR